MTKNLLCLFLAFQALLGVVSAQDIITKMTSTASGSVVNIEVKSGEVCEVLNYSGSGALRVVASLDPADPQAQGYIYTPLPNFPTLPQPFPIAGPCWLVLDRDNVYPAIISYRIRPNTSSTTTTPANAVVIPTDATGSVQIILESSTDLVTWTQANPGTYGASTTKRFFRIRAVNQ